MKNRNKKSVRPFQGMIFGSLLLAFFYPILGRTQDDPALVLVRSTYFDELISREISFTGVGTIVSRPNSQGKENFFVLTSAHLTQGGKLTLLAGGRKPLSLNQNPHLSCESNQAPRLANNRTDLELLEITDPEIKPFATWSEAEKRFFLTSEKREERDSVSPPFWNFFAFKPKIFTAGATLDGIPTSLQMPLVSWLTGADPQDRPLERGPTRWFGLLGSGEPSELETTLSGADLSLDSKTILGMSGTILIGRFPAEIPSILGVSKEISRNFNRSFFSTPDQITELVERYEKCQRGRVGDAQWKVRGGLLYRDLGAGTKEISPNHIAIGNGTTADGGDPGSGPPDPMDPYPAYQISEGMNWKGKPTLAFEIQNSSPSGSGALVYANIQALDYFESIHLRDDQILPIALNAPFLTLVKGRMEAFLSKRATDDRQSFFLKKMILRMIHNVLTNRNDPYTELDQVVDTGCKVTLHEGHKGRKNGYVHVQIGSQLSFDLSEKGSLLGTSTKSFNPIVEVIGKGLTFSEPSPPTLYRIDLRGLFATDLSSIFRRAFFPSVLSVEKYLGEYQNRLTLRLEGGEIAHAINLRCDAEIIPF